MRSRYSPLLRIQQCQLHVASPCGAFQAILPSILATGAVTITLAALFVDFFTHEHTCATVLWERRLTHDWNRVLTAEVYETRVQKAYTTARDES